MTLKSVFVTVLILGAAGCKSDPLDAERDQLRDRRQQWIAQNINDYSFTYTLSAFFDPALFGPWRIKVRNDQVVDVRSAQTGQPAPDDFHAMTIDDVFRRLEQHLEDVRATLSVDYDEQYGFPSRAQGDTRNVLDAAFLMTISDFVRE